MTGRLFTVVRRADEPSIVSITKTVPAPPRHTDGATALITVHRHKPPTYGVFPTGTPKSPGPGVRPVTKPK